MMILFREVMKLSLFRRTCSTRSTMGKLTDHGTTMCLIPEANLVGKVI